MDLAEAERRCIALPLTGEDAEALNILFGEYGRRGGKVNQQTSAIERVRALAVEWETSGGLAGAAAAERLRAALDG